MSKDIKKGSLDLGDLVYDGGELRIDFEAFNDWHRRFLKRFFDGVDASSGDTPDHFEKLYFEKVKQTLFDHTYFTVAHEINGRTGRTDNVAKSPSITQSCALPSHSSHLRKGRMACLIAKYPSLAVFGRGLRVLPAFSLS